jgi:sortase A
MTLVLPVAPTQADPSRLVHQAGSLGRGCRPPDTPATPPGASRARSTCAPFPLPRIGIVIPIAVALLIGGGVLVGQAIYIHAKALIAQVLLERAFAQALVSGQDVKPLAWADTWPVARVRVPRLGRGAIVLAGTSGQALAFGPGQVERTPAAGEPGTAIYSAHRDTHFAFLGKLDVGDDIHVVRRDGRAFRFRVTGTSVVRWDASGIDPSGAGRRLALVTCWPLDAKLPGPLRYVVHAELVEDIAAAK